MFHRTFTSVQPLEMYLAQLNCTFVRLEDEKVLEINKMEKLIDSKITEFLQLVDSGSKKAYQISIQFYEKKKKSWFTKEDDSWEEWSIEVGITRAKTERDQITARNQLEVDLQQVLMRISLESGSKSDHIPPIINSDPFPFEITFSNPSETLWTSMLTHLIPT